MTRRDSLQIGLTTIFGGGLANALRATSRPVGEAGPAPKAKSCILIWLDGGPTHYETFDPKPNAPVEYRGEFKAIPTRTPGMMFSEHLPKLAALSHRYSVIRSIQHNQGNHGAGNHYMMTGAPPRVPVGCGAFVSFHPSMGSVAAAEVGAPPGVPAYFAIPSMTRSGGPNFLGAKYAPFVVENDPNHPQFRVRDVALPQGLTDDRFANRGDLRTEVDRFQRHLDKQTGDPALALDQHYQQAAELMTSKEAQAAFSIARESERVRDAYGRNAFGQRLLLSRRLVEAGVPFVTLHHGGWDHHTNLFSSLKKLLPSFEASIATLIDDLHQRGMLETTMVIVLGEFGRTPQINKDAGRDHWSNAMSVLFAGGGTPGSQCIGATDAKGFAAVERILAPENFVSTVYSKLGIDPGKVVYAPNGRPSHLVSEPTPIAELMG